MSSIECDVAVIGAGTAGLSAERRARQTGAKTILIDPAFVGTTCANVGCMPSKLLISAARAAHIASASGVFGIRTEVVVDGATVMRRVRTERDRFARVTRDEIAKLPDGVVVKGRARFVDGETLALEDGRTVRAKAIVLATGARPSVPPSLCSISDLVLTNETVFELDTLPATLAVIGAGPLGLELAQAMARLGVATTVLDEGDAIGGLSGDVAEKLEAALSLEFEIHLGVRIEATIVDGDAKLVWSGASEGEQRFERVLVAAGRPPTVRDLDLEATGIELDEHGTPVFDRETMRCGDSSIFVAGDADADRPVLHEASSEGAIAGANAAKLPEIVMARRNVPFSIMFTDPPVAIVGSKPGGGLVSGQASYENQGRARVEHRPTGLVEIYADPGDGRLRGATLFCPAADHLGHLLAWSIEAGCTADDLLNRPFYHPTFEEGLKPALRSICEQVGLQLPDVSDEGGPPGA